MLGGISSLRFRGGSGRPSSSLRHSSSSRGFGSDLLGSGWSRSRLGCRSGGRLSWNIRFGGSTPCCWGEVSLLLFGRVAVSMTVLSLVEACLRLAVGVVY